MTTLPILALRIGRDYKDEMQLAMRLYRKGIILRGMLTRLLIYFYRQSMRLQN
jgi:hypothetical protein